MSKRILLLLWVVCSLSLPAMAQHIYVELYTQREGEVVKPKTGVDVYTFSARKNAQDALRKLQNGGAIGAADGVLEAKTSQGRAMQMRGSASGYLVLDDGFTVMEVVSCADHARQTDLGTFISYTLKEARMQGEERNKNANFIYEKFGYVNVLGRMTTPPEEAGTATICKNRLFYNKKVYLTPELCRDDARFVVVPLMVDVDTDSAYQLTPLALDGYDYHRTMHRRMGYLKDSIGNEQRDRLHAEVVPYRYMRTRQMDTLHVMGVFDKYDPTKRYRLMGHAWYEDYNSVYHKEVFTIWDGKPQVPQRYLDWKRAVVSLPIKAERYAREEIQQESKFQQHLALQFELGKHTLNLHDSTTVADMARIISNLRRIRSNRDSELKSVTIRGYSSPEGSLATNRSLSHRRAAEVINRITQGVGGGLQIRAAFDENDNIVPWSRVADYLDSLGIEETRLYAEAVRAAVAQHAHLNEQGRAIQRLACYPYIVEHVLPQLRQVIVEYVASESRVIPADETYQRYRAHEEGYWDGTSLFPYQYYHLMNRLYAEEDWDGLERIARRAYESPNTMLQQWSRKDVRDKRRPVLAQADTTLVRRQGAGVSDTLFFHKGDTLGYELKHMEERYRPYELAAYYLAQCKLRKGEVDTHMLEPYIDDSGAGLENQKRDGNGKLREWWNEEAIVLSQVMMYCADDDFEKASYYTHNHLPNDERFRLFRMMLRAMNCEWNNPEVRDAVAASSPMNACAMYIGQNTRAYYYKADSLLQDTTLFDQMDARVHYLRAICRFHLECATASSAEAPLYPSLNIYDPQLVGTTAAKQESLDWAAPMLRAFALDERNVEYIKNDGYFNDAYRTLVLFFWEQLKQGKTMEEIATQYDAFVTQYRNQKK